MTAVADLVPERDLIARPGTWSRNLHYQWMSFALSEMEAFLQSSEVNRLEFLLPREQHVPEIIEQNERLFKKSAAALDDFLAGAQYLVDNRFSVTDIFVGYTVSWGQEDGLLAGFPNLLAYLDRLLEREHCTLVRH